MKRISFLFIIPIAVSVFSCRGDKTPPAEKKYEASDPYRTFSTNHCDNIITIDIAVLGQYAAEPLDFTGRDGSTPLKPSIFASEVIVENFTTTNISITFEMVVHFTNFKSRKFFYEGVLDADVGSSKTNRILLYSPTKGNWNLSIYPLPGCGITTGMLDKTPEVEIL
ncbi:MAG: hypothetical protein P8P30_02970 [Rickettsiales bacterium]|nr:hypothetical protein [Rickettsiales bacterium]